MNVLAIRLSSELKVALTPLKHALIPILVISSIYNVLLLSGSFFMLLVYDDVLPSRSVPSLVSLLILVIVAYAFQALLDVIRGRIMVHLGSFFMRSVSDRILEVIARYELTRGTLPHGSQLIRDADSVRAYLSGPGPLAILDLPWIIIYLLVLSIFHWSIGLLSLFGVAVLLALMIANNRITSPLAKETMRASAGRANLAEATRRNAEVLKALGMGKARHRQWRDVELDYLQANERFSYLSSTLGGLTKSFRMFLQSATLALGAFLVIDGRATGGIIIAGSILSARALAPVEQVISNWKGMVAARLSLARMRDLLEALPNRIEPMGLELPCRQVEARCVTASPPGAQKVTLADVSFRLGAGDALAVVGRSGSGKTCLARTLCGVWPLLKGSIRLDGATLDQWPDDLISNIVGYVPQTIELFEGTIGQNISRFRENPDKDTIIQAARDADCHDLIVSLPGGYDYLIGPQGGGLSAGQQQRIALARAIYGNPFLVVLDEPNSNLDYEGEAALGAAIKRIRERKGIVVIVAHRPNVLTNVSHVMTMNAGRVERFETRSDFETRIRAHRSSKAGSDEAAAVTSDKNENQHVTIGKEISVGTVSTAAEVTGG